MPRKLPPLTFTDDDPIRAPGRESRLVRATPRHWLGRVVRIHLGRKLYPHWIYEPSVAGSVHTAQDLRTIADFLDQQNQPVARTWSRRRRPDSSVRARSRKKKRARR